MADLFDQLAQREVPPPPESLKDDVHHRLNYALLAGHVLDLALRGLPQALLEFGRAVIHLVRFSFNPHTQGDNHGN